LDNYLNGYAHKIQKIAGGAPKNLRSRGQAIEYHIERNPTGKTLVVDSDTPVDMNHSELSLDSPLNLPGAELGKIK
jgi:hypothetical protein